VGHTPVYQRGGLAHDALHHCEGKVMKIALTFLMMLVGLLGMATSFCGMMVGGGGGYLRGLSGIMFILAGHCFVGLIAMGAWREIPTWRVGIERSVFVSSGLALVMAAWVNTAYSPFGLASSDLSVTFICGAVLLLVIAGILLGLRVNSEKYGDAE
jgi:hypothetical protein